VPPPPSPPPPILSVLFTIPPHFCITNIESRTVQRTPSQSHHLCTEELTL
ncbi:unnamed protein product, partial [Staurois parvus]